MEAPLHPPEPRHLAVVVTVAVLLDICKARVGQGDPEVTRTGEAADLVVDVALACGLSKVRSAGFTVHIAGVLTGTADRCLHGAGALPPEDHSSFLPLTPDAERFVQEAKNLRTLPVHLPVAPPLPEGPPLNRPVADVHQRVGLVGIHPVPCDASYVEPGVATQPAALVIPGATVLAVPPNPSACESIAMRGRRGPTSGRRVRRHPVGQCP
mmetsp:Transcript_5584/g.15605  ORF Transcript_5584/g.15605 Transcript_5584/m.15605 type:complete len:211 (+) Transcript_5584:971-1603(+)